MGRTRPSDASEDVGQLKIASTVNKSRMSSLAVEYNIRGGFVGLTAFPGDRVSCPPSSSTLAFYEDQLKAGLRFLLHHIFCDILRIFKIIPSRLSPNSVRFIIGFIVLCHGCGIMPRASLFINFFVLKKDFHGDWWWVFVPHPGLKLFTGAPSAIHGWKSRFFFVGNAIGWDFDVRPKSPSTAPNNEGKHVLVGDKDDFDRLVASGVGERASDLSKLLDEACLRLAGLIPSAGLAPEEMVRPTAAKIRELARKKRPSTHEAEREARKKRKEDDAPQPAGAELAPLATGTEAAEELPTTSSPQLPSREEATPSEPARGDPVLESESEKAVAPTEAAAVGSTEVLESAAPPTSGIPEVEAGGPSADVGPTSGAERGASDAGTSREEERRIAAQLGFTLEEYDGLFIPDAPRVTDLVPFLERRAFDDADVAETVMKAVLLPKDWEETKQHPLEETAKSIFPDLLKVVHKAAALSEGIEGAYDVCRRTLRAYIELRKTSLNWRATAKNWAGIAAAKIELIEGLKTRAMGAELDARRHAREARVLKEKLEGEIESLKMRLEDSAAASLRKDEEAASLRLSLAEADSKVDHAQVVADEAWKEIERITAEMKSAKVKSDEEAAALKLALGESARVAVAEYKSSAAFEEEVAEAGASSYDVGFSDGVRQVKRLYPELDVSRVEPPEDDDDGDGEAEKTDSRDQGPTEVSEARPPSVEEPVSIPPTEGNVD